MNSVSLISFYIIYVLLYASMYIIWLIEPVIALNFNLFNCHNVVDLVFAPFKKVAYYT